MNNIIEGKWSIRSSIYGIWKTPSLVFDLLKYKIRQRWKDVYFILVATCYIQNNIYQLTRYYK